MRCPLLRLIMMCLGYQACSISPPACLSFYLPHSQYSLSLERFRNSSVCVYICPNEASLSREPRDADPMQMCPVRNLDSCLLHMYEYEAGVYGRGYDCDRRAENLGPGDDPSRLSDKLVRDHDGDVVGTVLFELSRFVVYISRIGGILIPISIFEIIFRLKI